MQQKKRIYSNKSRKFENASTAQIVGAFTAERYLQARLKKYF